MVFGEEAACPDWQTSEVAVENDEVIHYIHGGWLRDMDLSAKGSCPSAGCGMSCAEGGSCLWMWQQCVWSRAVDPGEQSAASLLQAAQQSSPPHQTEEHPSSSAL